MRPGLASFFRDLGVADQVLEIDKKNKTQVRQVLQQLNQLRIDILFCPHQSVRTALFLSRVKAQKKIAYRQWWNGLFFDECIERPMSLPEAMRSMALLQHYDPEVHNDLTRFMQDKNYHNSAERSNVVAWPHVIAEKYSMEIRCSEEKISAVQNKFQIRKPYVILAPSSQWPTKRWRAEGFIAVGKQLIAQGLSVYVVGGPTEVSDCDPIAQSISIGMARDGAQVRSLAGQTSLSELYALMGGAQSVLANDSGPMHVATLAGRPVVALFGPTTLDLGYRPWSDQSIVQQVALNCRPCGKHGHVRCPLGTHDCMKKISAEQVTSAVLGQAKRL